MKSVYAALFFLASATFIRADVIVLDFEGLQDGEGIGNYYNGGTGSLGSGPGTNYGISFGANSLATVQSNNGGTGNFGGEPSADTAAFFLSGSDVMDVSAGFTTGFSFYYSAINEGGTVNVFSGLDDTGTLLASLTLPTTPGTDSAAGGNCAEYGAASNPGANFCPFVPVGVTFSGTAQSVDFGGTANQIAFDNITLGSATPSSGAPEPSSMGLLAAGALLGGLVTKGRKAFSRR